MTRELERAGDVLARAAQGCAALVLALSRGPELLQQVSLLTPHAWFLRGIGDLAPEGAGVGTVLLPVGVLLLIGLVTGAIGLARARGLVVAR